MPGAGQTLRTLAGYLWRLVPGNPILQRVVAAASVRRRDLAVRCAYLAVLIAWVLYTLLTQLGVEGGGSLTALNKASARLFQQLSYLQLALVALLAPIFTAGAITQEKDSRTYDILLSTPLTNGQIVLGTLLSRMFFIAALLLSGVPILGITQIFGGVALGAIVMSLLIAVSTALLTGSLAVAIATLKVGSRRSILGFYVVIAVYLVGVGLLDGLEALRPTLTDGTTSATSVVTALHPFLALRTVFGSPASSPPEATLLPPGLSWWPMSWAMSSPASCFVALACATSAALVVPSIVLLRRLAQVQTGLGGLIGGWVWRWLLRREPDAERPPRPVWSNPIAWREAVTQGASARAWLTRWLFGIAGISLAVALLVGYVREQSPTRFISPRSVDAESGLLLIFDRDQARPVQLPQDGPPVVVRKLGERGEAEETTLAIVGRRLEVLDVQLSGGVLTQLTVREVQRRLPVGLVRQLLLALILVESAALLLIVTNAAAGTVTREKEDGTLDLLLTTPITSRYYIWGKLRGLVQFVLPLIGVPTATVLLFVLSDTLDWASGDLAAWAVLPESVVLVPAVLLVLSSFAAMVGMQASLACRTTVRAVMLSVVTVAGAVGLLGMCGERLLAGTSGSSVLALAMSAFSPVTVLMLVVDPLRWAGTVIDETTLGQSRAVVAGFAVLSLGVYATVVHALYRSMVRNFDMTIRRQSR